MEENNIDKKLEQNNNEMPSEEEVKEVFSQPNTEMKEDPIKIQEKIKKQINFSELYDKYYKVLLIIPLIILALSLIYLYNFNSENGDIISKDITLTGGTSIQINTGADINEFRNSLEENFDQVSVRQISDITTGEQLAIVVETTASVDEIKSFIEGYLNIQLTSENSSTEFTGSSLSGSFYNQLRFALILSFILMAGIVFFIFRSFTPSMAVVFAAFADIVFTVTVVNLLGINVSTAGIVAFLMLIGYSVDTDILLTTRVLKRFDGSVNERIYGAFKTGVTMTLTSLLVVLVGLYFTSSISKVFNQIFTILTIGLLFDLFNTWFFNASIIKYYVEKK